MTAAELARLSQLEGVNVRQWLQVRAKFQEVCTKDPHQRRFGVRRLAAVLESGSKLPHSKSGACNPRETFPEPVKNGQELLSSCESRASFPPPPPAPCRPKPDFRFRGSAVVLARSLRGLAEDIPAVSFDP